MPECLCFQSITSRTDYYANSVDSFAVLPQFSQHVGSGRPGLWSELVLPDQSRDRRRMGIGADQHRSAHDRSGGRRCASGCLPAGFRSSSGAGGRGGCLHSVGRNGGNKYGRSAGQACGERTDLRITEPLTRTAIDLINSIFSRPQSGVAANARCITRPQLELLRRLIGEDEEGGAMQSHYAEPG